MILSVGRSWGVHFKYLNSIQLKCNVISKERYCQVIGFQIKKLKVQQMFVFKSKLSVYLWNVKIFISVVLYFLEHTLTRSSPESHLLNYLERTSITGEQILRTNNIFQKVCCIHLYLRCLYTKWWFPTESLSSHASRCLSIQLKNNYIIQDPLFPSLFSLALSVLFSLLFVLSRFLLYQL